MGRRVTVYLVKGDVYGSLEVLNPEAGRVGRTRHRPKGTRAAEVKCLRCGTVKLVRIGNLTNGITVSCGCYRRLRYREARETALVPV
jgi:hypothetical protein